MPTLRFPKIVARRGALSPIFDRCAVESSLHRPPGALGFYAPADNGNAHNRKPFPHRRCDQIHGCITNHIPRIRGMVLSVEYASIGLRREAGPPPYGKRNDISPRKRGRMI